MIDWIYQINWVLIVMVTIGVVFGTEFGRRRAEAEGEIHSFLPLWKYRVLGLLVCLGGGLLFESAKIAVKMPTTFHVWMLIFTTAAVFLFSGMLFGLELRQAKKALKDAKAAGGNP